VAVDLGNIEPVRSILLNIFINYSNLLKHLSQTSVQAKIFSDKRYFLLRRIYIYEFIAPFPQWRIFLDSFLDLIATGRK